MTFKKILYPLLSTTCFCSTLLATNSHASGNALTLELIGKLNRVCLEKADKKNYHIAIAIYDAGGNLISFIQKDETAPGIGKVARWKANSAAIYRTSTAVTASWNVPTAPEISTAQGGVPIFSSSGHALGAMGVSGAPPEFDEACANAAIEAGGFKTQ